MNYFIVKYCGPFGFIKPWTAVRDGETFSQQFLTPSILEGMEKKLFEETLDTVGLQGYIVGSRLNYTGISLQQEQTWSKTWIEKAGESIFEQRIVKKKGVEKYKEVKIRTITRRPNTGILTRGVLIEPNLYLAFSNRLFAERAFKQHICLGRNEDLLFPEEITEATKEEWRSEVYPGFELLHNYTKGRQYKVGYNRFDNTSPMYGELKSFGDPIRKRADYL
jgi:hypothetical protein